MHGGNQESVLVQIVVDRDPVPFTVVRRAVVAKFTVTVARNFELTFKVVDPSANERGGISGKILFKNFYFIQFLPRNKDTGLKGKLKD